VLRTKEKDKKKKGWKGVVMKCRKEMGSLLLLCVTPRDPAPLRLALVPRFLPKIMSRTTHAPMHAVFHKETLLPYTGDLQTKIQYLIRIKYRVWIRNLDVDLDRRKWPQKRKEIRPLFFMKKLKVLAYSLGLFLITKRNLSIIFAYKQ